MSGRRHILLISMHYRPEPCDTRTSQLAKALVARGYQATVLTSFPNYPYGKVYEGYRQRLFQIEHIDGVRVVRVPMFADHSKSKVRRALSYLSFGVSAAVLGAFLTRRPDAVWIHHPPLTTGFAGWILARIKRRPFVYEIHDLWPESLTSTGMIREGRLTGAIRKACAFLHRRASAIVVTSAGMRTHLAKQGVDPSRMHVFPQWADEAVFRPVEPETEEHSAFPSLDGYFHVVYGGNLGVAQALDTVLSAAKLVAHRPEVRFAFVGTGVETNRLQNRAEDEGLTNVQFLGHIPTESMPPFFGAADALLVHLTKDPLFAITIPSKLQTYMAMEKPVLCGVAGDAADVVRSANCGRCFEPENAEAMAAAILELADLSKAERRELGRRAREAYLATFSQAALMDGYEALFEKICRPAKHLTISDSAVVLAPAESERTAA